MSLSVLIFRFDPTFLRLLCVVGFVSGLAAILLASRKQQTSRPPNPFLQRTGQDEILGPTARPASSQPEAIPQVIRLSLPSIATRSTEMTQQEKVAAALTRAGFSNPISWTDSSSTTDDVPQSASTSTAIADSPAPNPKPSVITSEPSTPQARFSAGRKLLLLTGALIALLSLYFLLRIH